MNNSEDDKASSQCIKREDGLAPGSSLWAQVSYSSVMLQRATLIEARSRACPNYTHRTSIYVYHHRGISKPVIRANWNRWSRQRGLEVGHFVSVPLECGSPFPSPVEWTFQGQREENPSLTNQRPADHAASITMVLHVTHSSWGEEHWSGSNSRLQGFIHTHTEKHIHTKTQTHTQKHTYTNFYTFDRGWLHNAFYVHQLP